MTLPEELRAAAQREASKWGGPYYLMIQAANVIEEQTRVIDGLQKQIEDQKGTDNAT